MQQSVSASQPNAPVATGYSGPAAEPWWPNGWWRIMDTRIGIIPIPVFVILFLLLAGLTYSGDIKGEVSTMIAVLVIGGFTCAEIGKRITDSARHRRGSNLRDVYSLRSCLLQAAAAPDREVDHRIHEIHQFSVPVQWTVGFW